MRASRNNNLVPTTAPQACPPLIAPYFIVLIVFQREVGRTPAGAVQPTPRQKKTTVKFVIRTMFSFKICYRLFIVFYSCLFFGLCASKTDINNKAPFRIHCYVKHWNEGDIVTKCLVDISIKRIAK